MFGAEVAVNPDGLARIDVLCLHEPAWLVGADRQQREVEAAAGAVAAADRAGWSIFEVRRCRSAKNHWNPGAKTA